MRNTLCISFLNICALCFPPFCHRHFPAENKRYAKDGSDRYLHPQFHILGFGIFYRIYAAVFGKQRPEQYTDGTGVVKEPVNPLTNAKHAGFIQVAIGAWKTLGYNAIIYLSAILPLIRSCIRRRIVDGANTWQKIVHVTVPDYCRPSLVLLLLAISTC